MHLKSVCLLSAFFSLSSTAVASKTCPGKDTGPSKREINFLKGAVTQYQLTNPLNDEVACACYLLRKFDKYALSWEGEEEYLKEANGYWSATVWTTPRCIFTPSGASDVAKGITIMRECKALFAVKGGGHYPVRSICTCFENIKLIRDCLAPRDVLYYRWRPNCPYKNKDPRNCRGQKIGARGAWAPVG